VPTLAGLVIIETRRAKPTDALDHTQRETAEAAAPAHAFEARRGACHRAIPNLEGAGETRPGSG